MLFKGLKFSPVLKEKYIKKPVSVNIKRDAEI